MTDLDLLHFEQLKKEVQAQYLKEHTPSYDDISKWKGIDIIYFQEDLRKKAKGNISEKSFYTYFKNSPVTKLPRIDMLNLLSMYAGYESWYEFKKQHLFAGELLQDNEEPEDAELKELEKTVSASIDLTKNDIPSLKTEIRSTDITDLQKSDTENQTLNPKEKISQTAISEPEKPKKNFLRKNVWVLVTAFLIIATGLLGFKDVIFQKTYVYCFTDADRNMSIQREIEIKVIKDNESPILYRIKPGECFRYATKDKILKMQISSPFYEYHEVSRNLENAPE